MRGWRRPGLAVAALGLLCVGVASAEPVEDVPWPGEAPGTERRVLSFAELDGWAEDDLGPALAAFKETCPDLSGPDWPGVCALAHDLPPAAARAFFETLFRPVIATDGEAALLTGYFEPELEGSRRRSMLYRYPLYARPPELPDEGPWLTRRQIEEGGRLKDRGLVLAWVADPVDAYFLQIQGSGRIRLAEGGTLRLGYGGANGRERRSVGQEMVRRGILEPGTASAAAIRAWVRAHPDRGRRILQHDPAFVFFREVDVPEDRGPLGAMLRSITPLRSVAVDPAHVPLGAPVWVEGDGAEPVRRLMVAQDVGSAIRGPQRADLFFGTGAEAGRRAGRVSDPGRIVALLPIRMAHAMAPDPMGVRSSPAEGSEPARAVAAAGPAAPASADGTASEGGPATPLGRALAISGPVTATPIEGPAHLGAAPELSPLPPARPAPVRAAPGRPIARTHTTPRRRDPAAAPLLGGGALSRRPRGVTPGERALWDAHARRYAPLEASRAHRAPAEPPRAPPDRPAPASAPDPFRPPLEPGAPVLFPFRLGERARALHGTRDVAPPLAEALSRAPLAMDRRAHRALVRGRARPEARLDLHGMTLDRAHPALTAFVRRAHARGLRLLLVITGKGRPDDGTEVIPRPRGVLRHQVPAWLARPPLSALVQQIAPAHRRHGGEGAYYVYLRRARTDP